MPCCKGSITSFVCPDVLVSAAVCGRQSKLTAALRDAIGGNSNTVMIANLWPEEAHLEECVSTLRFAARVRCLQTDAQVNESADPLLALKKAERQIKELRQELAMRDMLSGRGRVVYEDLSDGERLELQQLVLRYLSGEHLLAVAWATVDAAMLGVHPSRAKLMMSQAACNWPW